jgi:hypothetical protein
MRKHGTAMFFFIDHFVCAGLYDLSQVRFARADATTFDKAGYFRGDNTRVSFLSKEELAVLCGSVGLQTTELDYHTIK